MRKKFVNECNTLIYTKNFNYRLFIANTWKTVRGNVTTEINGILTSVSSISFWDRYAFTRTIENR